MNNRSNIQKLTISAMVVALYIVVLYLTQSISFGAYQIRIATSLYALSYLFPFLVVPMGMANLISNFFFGGLGPIDMIGGFLGGIFTTGTIVLLRRYNFGAHWIVLPITLIPSLCVSAWLSYLLNIPYSALVVNLIVGQFVCGVVGSILARTLEKRMFGTTSVEEVVDAETEKI